VLPLLLTSRSRSLQVIPFQGDDFHHSPGTKPQSPESWNAVSTT
jgi:hypothetical protein